MTTPPVPSDTDRLAAIRARFEHQLMVDRSVDTIAARDHAAAVDDRAELLSIVDRLQGRVETAEANRDRADRQIRVHLDIARAAERERLDARVEARQLRERLDTAEGRLRELASKQDRIPDTDNGDWGLGYDQGYNAAYGEVRAIAAEGLDQGSGVSQ